jgi:hypothetical protein
MVFATGQAFEFEITADMIGMMVGIEDVGQVPSRFVQGSQYRLAFGRVYGDRLV